MRPGSNTESYPAFACIGLRENPGKNLNQYAAECRTLFIYLAHFISFNVNDLLLYGVTLFKRILDKILYDVNKSDILRKLLQCVTNANVQVAITVHNVGRHEHGTLLSEIQVREIVAAIKRRTRDHPNEPPTAIVREETQNVEDEATQVLLPERQAILRMCRSWSALARNTEVIEKLEASLREKDEKIASLERKLEDKQDALEQYQRWQCLRLFGIPEKNNEDTDQIAIEVAAKIGVNLMVSDIDRSHRVVRQGDRPRPVIVKCVSYRKSLIKKCKKNSGVMLREDLNQSRHALLKDCITRYGLTNVWTTDGIIFVKIGNVKHKIVKASDLP
ncbi:hypothetical protein ANN_04047 [Periplaneta americana]|uniref:Uncharacterized protein n=1 Tax=Periplaneta americana TaxID=6978 RepID=A0ABQ8T8P7_PERAM|nr:hypothetical protein ANN_04047 [Periplaneta americana]